MTAMRIYVAATLPLLAQAKASGRVTNGPTTAYAVTPRLREWYFEGDLEELEYAAQSAAGRASLALLAADPHAPRRRVVLAADVPEGSVTAVTDGGRHTIAQVGVSEPVPWSALASLQVDGHAAERLIAEAAHAVVRAEEGDEDAQFVVDSAEDESLLWYGVQEADDLLGDEAGGGSGRSHQT
jgi:hypothetical protein